MVGLTPTRVMRSREPGSSVAATRNGAAEEKSPGTSTCSGSSFAARPDLDTTGFGTDPRAGGPQHPLGVVAGRDRLNDGRRARRPRRAPRGGRTTSPARWRPGARSGSGAAAAPSIADRQMPVGASPRRRPSGRAARDAPHRPRAERLVARQLEAGRPVPRAGRAAGARAFPRCHSRSARPATEARAGRRRRRAAVSPSSSTWTPSARTAATVDSVSPDRPKPVTTLSPSAIAPSSTARWEIDLSPGSATPP